MSLITVSAQLVSILRAKSWKLVIICKNNMFPNFPALFLKMYIFEIVIFSFHLMLVQSTNFFSGGTYYH